MNYQNTSKIEKRTIRTVIKYVFFVFRLKSTRAQAALRRCSTTFSRNSAPPIPNTFSTRKRISCKVVPPTAFSVFSSRSRIGEIFFKLSLYSNLQYHRIYPDTMETFCSTQTATLYISILVTCCPCRRKISALRVRRSS